MFCRSVTYMYGESLFVRNTVRITTYYQYEWRWDSSGSESMALCGDGMVGWFAGCVASLSGTRSSTCRRCRDSWFVVASSPYGNFLIIAPVLVHRFRVPCRYSIVANVEEQTMIEVSALCARACTCVCRTTNNNGHRRRIWEWACAMHAHDSAERSCILLHTNRHRLRLFISKCRYNNNTHYHCCEYTVEIRMYMVRREGSVFCEFNRWEFDLI